MIPRIVSFFLFLVLPFGLLAEPGEYRVIRDIVYSEPDDKALLLDLYLPDNESRGPFPAVVWVHGGGWKNGSKANCRAEYLAEHGFAVASINYRLTHEAIWPAQINDCRESVRWLRSNAKKYNLDPKNIGAWGSSAGGHLVALMGTLPVPEKETISSSVQAVCDWYGPTELLSMPPNNVGNGRTAEDVANSNGAKLLGCTVRDCPDLARQASALDNISSDDPPFLIMHGDLDPGVPLTQSTRFYHKLQNQGVDAHLEIVEGAGHGGPLFNSDLVRDRVLNFFEQTLR